MSGKILAWLMGWLVAIIIGLMLHLLDIRLCHPPIYYGGLPTQCLVPTEYWWQLNVDVPNALELYTQLSRVWAMHSSLTGLR